MPIRGARGFFGSPGALKYLVVLGSVVLGSALFTSAHEFDDGYTDSVLTVMTSIRAIHVGELRNAVAARWMECGLGPPSWSELITAGSTGIRVAHINELRINVNILREHVTAGSSFPFAEAIAPGVRIKAGHIQELRDALVGVRCTGGAATPVCPYTRQTGDPGTFAYDFAAGCVGDDNPCYGITCDAGDARTDAVGWCVGSCRRWTWGLYPPNGCFAYESANNRGAPHCRVACVKPGPCVPPPPPPPCSCAGAGCPGACVYGPGTFACPHGQPICL